MMTLYVQGRQVYPKNLHQSWPLLALKCAARQPLVVVCCFVMSWLVLPIRGFGHDGRGVVTRLPRERLILAPPP